MPKFKFMVDKAIDYLSKVSGRNVSYPDFGWQEKLKGGKSIYTKGDTVLEYTYLEDLGYHEVIVHKPRKKIIGPKLIFRLKSPNKKFLNYLRSMSNFWTTKEGDTVFIYPDVDMICVF